MTDVEIGLGNRFRLRTQLAAGHASGGFLDPFVIDFHDAFGFDDQGRPGARDGQFNVFVERRGVRAFELDDDGVNLFDIPIELSWVGRQAGVDGAFGYGFRAGLELPTGPQDRGFGNGELDFAAGVFFELRPEPMPWLSLTGNAQHTFAGTPNRARRAGLEFRDVTTGGVGAEAFVTDRFALIAQIEAGRSTLRGLGFARASNPQMILWTGARLHVGPRTYVEAALGEDLAPSVSPDFVVVLGFGTRF